MSWLRSAAGLLGLCCGLSACAPSQVVCKPDPITGNEQCQGTSSAPASAIVTTGAAVGVYGLTGCTVNGCQLPDQCNPTTKRCETIRCTEQKPCPAGYSCDRSTMMCR